MGIAMQKFEKATRLGKDYAGKLKKERGIVSIVQIGSSLRREDFKPNSDLDFLVIYENPVKKSIELEDIDGVEINLIRYGKKQFVKSLEEGNSVDLIALRFGKVLHDDGFFAEMKEKGFRPSEKTIDKWIRTATFNLMDAAMNYSFPACLCCYFKAIHHAAREFCRAVILKEEGDLLEGDANVLRRLKSSNPELYRKFRMVTKGRGSYEKFEAKYIKSPKIRNSGLGKYLLATEDIAIEALKITMGLNVPKVNKLISKLQKSYKIDHYHSFYLAPEHKSLMLNLGLKGGKLGFFEYSLENGELVKVHTS